MNPSPKTVLITGSSSGIGLETALYFYEKGWHVVAAMRSPEKRRTRLHEKGLPDLVHLDVTDTESIRAALEYTLDKYHRLDVLVNNAGYAVYGPFESASAQQVQRQFDTNVFGLMEVCRQALPYLRRQQGGTIINVASMGGRVGFPLYSLYNSTKWAVEGFSEALQYELSGFNIKVRLIEPGVISTDFYERSIDQGENAEANRVYAEIIQRARKQMGGGASPRLVAACIYRAAVERGDRLRYIVGGDALQVSWLRRLLPEGLFYRLLKKVTLA
ncbi:MAG: SDR family oxidoreductase [Anaerolineae bacterium]|nr:SDR family oxidoreductase [Anaerolineae bacterium]